MRLFHFSEDPRIARFEPRPVAIPSTRSPGREWLNGALVWAIDEAHQGMYLFPRDCPRILAWPTERTSAHDRHLLFDGSAARRVAFIEARWSETLRGAELFRYELPSAAFESLEDAGMWVSKAAVSPNGVDRIDNLPSALHAADVELREVESLASLKTLWRTSLHVSGIRLRNAESWN